jgi:hypothetical protein
MHYKNWSALDLALILELTLQKDGDKQENIRSTLTSLSSPDKVWKHGDESLPLYCRSLLDLPDPVKATRDVVNNFYELFTQSDEFEEQVSVSETVEAKLTDALLDTVASVYHELVADDLTQRLRDIGTGKIPLDQVHVV